MALEANIDLNITTYANAIEFNIIFDAYDGTTCSSKLNELKSMCKNQPIGTSFSIPNYAPKGASGLGNGYVKCICMRNPKDDYTCEYAGGGLYYSAKRLAGVAKCC